MHFTAFDFVTTSVDTNKSRWNIKKVMESPLSKRSLKPNAVPSIFLNLPKHLSSNKLNYTSKQDVNRPSSSKRLEYQQQHMDKMEHEFFEADKIMTFLKVTGS